MNKKVLALVVFSVVFPCFSFASEGIVEIPIERVEAAFEIPVVGHPRLFLTDGQLAGVRKKIAGSSKFKLLYANILKEADELIGKEPVKRIIKGEGGSLLSVSRRCLHRVMVLSFAWRISGEDKYLERGEQELLAAAGFSDWNPSGFLATAEMTTAVSIGYDWLYNGLGKKSREIIKAAIVTKGIKASLKGDNSWLTRRNNWNQVCNGGMVVGSLAVMEDEPELARQIVHRAVNSIQLAMAGYEPDGAYPEGPMYWVYGTSYNVLLLAALDSVLGTEFGLSQKEGFANSCYYYLHMAGPSGLYFNYPDSGRRGSLQPTVFWFAEKYDDRSLLWNQHHYFNAESAPASNGLIPLALAWGTSGDRVVPKDLTWMGRGINPVAAFRSSWTDPDAVYLGIKGGSPWTNHGHMDVGSFVIDADGVRWAFDLGAESYQAHLWGRLQHDERWMRFRYNNFSHNTLVVNDQLQRALGMAPIIRYSKKKSFSNVVIDMTSVYAGHLKKALRGGGLLGDGRIVIQDELEAGAAPAIVRWAMMTAAKVDIQSARKAVLREDGKSLGFEIVSPKDVKIAVYSAQGPADYDSPNPGKRMIGFEVKLAAGERQRLVVVMTPGGKTGIGEYAETALLSWSEKINGDNPLFMVAQDGHTEIVQALLAAKAHVNAEKFDGRTSLWIAAHEGHTEIVKALLAANADVNIPRNVHGATPLYKAAQNGHTETVKSLLEAKPDVNAEITDGRTALWIAVKNGHTEIVKSLLESKADVNAKNKTTGVTPLYIAAVIGHTEIVKLLLAAGADVKAKASDGHTPLSIAKEMGHDQAVRWLKKYGAED